MSSIEEILARIDPLIAEVTAWGEKASEELEQLAEIAEQTCRYEAYDSTKFDHAERGWEYMSELLSLLTDLREQGLIRTEAS